MSQTIGFDVDNIFSVNVFSVQGFSVQALAAQCKKCRFEEKIISQKRTKQQGNNKEKDKEKRKEIRDMAVVTCVIRGTDEFRPAEQRTDQPTLERFAKASEQKLFPTRCVIAP